MLTTGSRRQVFNGSAKHTSGGLEKKDLKMNKFGRIVSANKSRSAKKDNRLVKAGYGTKKGHFGWVRVGSKKSRTSHKKSRKSHKKSRKSHKKSRKH